MGPLTRRIEAARQKREQGTVGQFQVTVLDEADKPVTSPWVKAAGEGARIGQPLSGRGIPLRFER